MKIKKFPELFSKIGIFQGATWLILLTAAVILLFLLGRNSLVGAEGETAEMLRELLLGRDIFDPACRPEYSDAANLWSCRFRIIPAMISGIDEFTCRLPSIFAACFMLGGTMLLAKDYFNRRTMYTVGWLLVGSCGFIYWGRFAGNYMTLAAWGIWSAVLLRYARNVFWWRGIFFIFMLIGIAWWGMNYLLLLPGILLMTWQNCSKAVFHWKSLPILAAVLPVVIVLLMWVIGFAEISWQQHIERLWIQCAAGFMKSYYGAVWPGNCGIPWFEGILNLHRMFFPWNLLVLAAVVSMVKKFKYLSGDHRLLLCGTVLIWLLIGIFPPRLWQYQLPILPFFLLITGGVVTGCVGELKWNKFINRVMVWLIGIFCSLAVAVIVTWPLWEMVLQASPPMLIMWLVPLLGLLGLAFLVFDTGSGSKIESVSGMNGIWSGYILGGVCFMSAVLAVTYPAVDIFRSQRPFWRECGRLTRHLPAREVIFAGERPSAIARYYMALPQRCTEAAELDKLLPVLQQVTTGEAMIIMRRGTLPEVEQCLAGTPWQLITSDFPVVEGGIVSFSPEKPYDESKFIVCRAVKK